jgi:uncharacterized protein involved in exopolysaccharide biosynthesis
LWARDNKRNDTLTEALQQAQGELAFNKAKLEELKRLDRSSLRKALLTVVPTETLLPQRLDELAAVEQKLAQLKQDYGPDNQEVKRAEAWHQQIGKQVEDRLDGIMTGLSDTVAAYKARVEALQQQLDEEQKRVTDRDIQARSYFDSQRDLETQQKIRDALLLRARQEQVDTTIPTQNQVEVVDRAEPGLRPVSPNRYLAGALGMSGLLFVFAGISLRRAPQPAPAKA